MNKKILILLILLILSLITSITCLAEDSESYFAYGETVMFTPCQIVDSEWDKVNYVSGYATSTFNVTVDNVMNLELFLKGTGTIILPNGYSFYYSGGWNWITFHVARNRLLVYVGLELKDNVSLMTGSGQIALNGEFYISQVKYTYSTYTDMSLSTEEESLIEHLAQFDFKYILDYWGIYENGFFWILIYGSVFIITYIKTKSLDILAAVMLILFSVTYMFIPEFMKMPVVILIAGCIAWLLKRLVLD